MATTFKTLYASNASITITLASLTTGSFRQSAAVDNTTNLYLDANIFGKITSGGTPTATGQYTVYLYWSNDNGTTFTNNASGSDASYTPDLQANLMSGDVSGTTATASLASFFHGFSFCRAAGLLYLPSKWGIIVWNNSGATISATGASSVFSYQGVNTQGV